MNAIIKKAYAVYSTDSRGYAQGEPISIYLLYAAAEASNEYKNLMGYGCITPIELLQFEDINYLLNWKIDKSKVIGKLKLGEPTKCYQDYIYEDRWDKSVYIIGDEELIKYIDGQENRSISIYKKYIIKDSNDYYILRSDKTYNLKSFILTRDIAVKHALGKLTEEEKKLLGLM